MYIFSIKHLKWSIALILFLLTSSATHIKHTSLPNSETLFRNFQGACTGGYTSFFDKILSYSWFLMGIPYFELQSKLESWNLSNNTPPPFKGYTFFSSNLWSKFSQCYCIVTRECYISPESLCRELSKFTHYFDPVAMATLLALWLSKHGNGCNY